MDKRLKYKLQPPNEQTVRRMMEVEFYLAFRHLVSLTYGETSTAAHDFIKSIAILGKVEQYTLLFPYREITTFGGTPTKEEIVITLYYYGLSYRDIYKVFGIHPDTVRKYIRRYIAKGHPPLKPRLGLNFRDELVKALDVVGKTIAPLIFPTTIISSGKRARELWNKGDK
ncbi:helix-turn-helix domain-containing protein [Neobacillus sp. 179-C4.2 HS]|uniref:Helix-turn-helix domain-containing protein n=1 Tax=Neobacillus driksii TaxID=3035913 RepID=A0ABV4YRI8_9BACI|nr:helix-turn-helix domain-containing protein [Neobacillus sp. 179.-C4.2 HS]MDP5195053.1 helix-turn-helix domain containing protein [Neobacillus sp. 179.-C4.2 HS]